MQYSLLIGQDCKYSSLIGQYSWNSYLIGQDSQYSSLICQLFREADRGQELGKRWGRGARALPHPGADPHQARLQLRLQHRNQVPRHDADREDGDRGRQSHGDEPLPWPDSQDSLEPRQREEDTLLILQSWHLYNVSKIDLFGSIISSVKSSRSHNVCLSGPILSRARDLQLSGSDL